MKLGLQVVRFDWPGSPNNIGPTLAAIGQAADAAGFDSLWVMDHFFQMDMPHMGLRPEEPMLDSYTALSYLAAVTDKRSPGRHGHGRQLSTSRTSTQNRDRARRAVRRAGEPWHRRGLVRTRGGGSGFPLPAAGRTL